MKSVLTLGGVLVCSSLTVAALADPLPAPKLHAAAASAINVLEQSIRVWHQRRTCYSCHHQGLPVALAAEARARGVQVDEALARRNLSLGLQGLKNLDRAVQSAQQIDPATDTGSQLVAARVAGVPQGLARAVYAAIIAKKQRPDGSWETLDNRPPQSWSRVTATAMGVTAIRAYMPESRQQETEERVRRAGDWLLAARPRDTEDRAYQIFGAIEAGVDRVAVKPMADALLTAQRPDGGWAQLASRASDAYATGEALVALYEAGVGPTAPAFQRGLRYLLDSQFPDGSWRVATRMHEQDLVSPPHFETGFPHGADQMISVMGTVWATRALLRALPEGRMRTDPLVAASDWRDEEAAPWMPVALFGTAAELERLLTAGLDPNSRTAAGTTILMMAAGDLDKVDTLVRHGADVNLAAKTGFTPLMIAANDPDATPAIRSRSTTPPHCSLPSGLAISTRCGCSSLGAPTCRRR
jgi:Ankyrin repeats (3 copies)/Prenyltransferase and squalene oxidase repeat